MPGKRSAATSPGPWPKLAEALRGLDATGPAGFEGLIRDLLTGISGQPFRLAKSGPQGGGDGASNRFDMVFEAKRYGAGTPLPLDQLKAKLNDAISSHDGLDLWLLATTREISANDAKSLKEFGAQHGVAVELLDWPRSSAQLPPLAVLCASAPDDITRAYPALAGLGGVLAEIRGDRRYQSEHDALIRRLSQPDIGYAAARRSMAGWLRTAFQDCGQAKARLDSGSVDLLNPTTRRIQRPGVMNAIDGWWQRGAAEPLALLGEEGTGKTWAALAWWHERAGPDGSGLPLTLIVPARQLTSSEPETLVGQLLAKRTGLRSPEFWQRRVERWLKAAPGPLLLILLDGLNEAWSERGWSTILSKLHADPWRQKVATALTCRPDHWDTQLHGLADAIPQPTRYVVKDFGDQELDDLLTQAGLSRTDFPDDLVALMRVPRLCRLAIEHRIRLQESGDITRERLIYEDWKHRLRLRADRGLVGDADFKQFIADRGRRLWETLGQTGPGRDPLTRRQILEHLGRDSGAGPEALTTTISELVDGRWFCAAGPRQHHFRLNPQFAPFALGLALVEDLSGIPEAGGPDRLAQLLQPLREQDFAVDILRAAATIALADGSTRRDLRRLVVDAWLSSRNLDGADFDSHWRIIGLDPDLFLDRAEALWLAGPQDHSTEEFLIKGFANAHQWPPVAERLRERCTRWLGWYCDDWHSSSAKSSVSQENARAAEQRREAARQRRRDWDRAAPGFPEPPVLESRPETMAAFFGRPIAALISFLPRAPFVPALTAWAVSRAIMDEAPEYANIAWLLRLNPHDPDETKAEISRAATALAALGEPVAIAAARWLLSALATPCAQTLESTLPERAPGERWHWPDHVTFNDATGVVDWNYRTAATWGRCQSVPLGAAKGLNDHAINPDAILPADGIAELERLAALADVGGLWHGRRTTDHDLGVDNARLALARWAPAALGNLLRRLFASAATREPATLGPFCWYLHAHHLILSEDERRTIVDGLLMIGSKTPFSKEKNQNRIVDDLLLPCQLYGRSAAEQLQKLAEQPDAASNMDLSNEPLFSAPTTQDFETLTEYLAIDQPPRRLTGWLGYLMMAPLDAMPKGYLPLQRLISHPDPNICQLALKVIWFAQQPELDLAVAQSSWRYTPDGEQETNAYGSLVLCRFLGDRPLSEIRDRIDPIALADLVTERGRDEDLEAFGTWIDEQMTAGREKGNRLERLWCDANKAFERLVQAHGERVAAWVATLLGPQLLSFFPASRNEICLGLCRALLLYRPSEGARLWKTLVPDEHSKISYYSPKFDVMPLVAPDGPVILPLRTVMLDRAKSDRDLSVISEAVIRHGRQSWLIDQIRIDLSGPAAGRIARGLTLAGLLDSSPAADALWTDTLATAPAPGWLAQVHVQAKGLYQRNRWARHWLDLFLASRDRDQAFGAFQLFLACVDDRARAWLKSRVEPAWPELPREWQQHLSLCTKDVDRAIKKQDDERKDILYGTKILSGASHRPWA